MTRTVAANEKWQPIFLVKIYRLARLGVPEVQIFQSLHVARDTYYRWVREKPGLREALAMAEAERSDAGPFADFVWNRFSPELQDLWRKVQRLNKSESGIAAVEALLADHGEGTRQRLFLHALSKAHFSPTKACQLVGVTKKRLDQWLREDGGFAELVEEIGWHKGNFFEEALVRLVQAGDTAATIFANKSWNADRGYQTAAKVNVEHSGAVLHGVLDLAELLPHLSDGCRAELLSAIRMRDDGRRALEMRPPDPTAVLDRQISDLANPRP